MSDETMAARALAKKWLRAVAALPTTNADQQAAAGFLPDIWKDLDVAFRQPVVESIFTSFRPQPAESWLAARSVMLDPPLGVEDLSEETRRLVGYLTIQVFNDESQMLSTATTPGDSYTGDWTLHRAELWLDTIDDEVDIVLLLAALEHDQYAGDLPDWFVPAERYELFTIAHERNGPVIGEIMTCSRHGRWFVAIPPATIAGMRSSGGGDFAGDRVPRVPNAPQAAGAEALDERE